MAWTLQNTVSVPNGGYTEFTPVLVYFFETFLPTYAGDHFTLHAASVGTPDGYWWYEYTVKCMTGEDESFKSLVHYEGVNQDFECRAWNDPAATAGDLSMAGTDIFDDDTSHSRTLYKGDYLFYTGENGAFMVLGPGSGTVGYNDVVTWWPGPDGWIYQGDPNPDNRPHYFPFMDSRQFACPYGQMNMYPPLANVQNSGNKVLISDLAGFSLGKGNVSFTSSASINWYVPRLVWMAPPTENNYKVKWHSTGTVGPGSGTPGHVVLDDGKYWLDFWKGSNSGLLTLVGDTPLTLPYPE